MMGFGLIITGLIVFAFIYLLNDRGQVSLLSTSSSNKSALDIAKERYALGEITKEEFAHLRQDLES